MSSASIVKCLLSKNNCVLFWQRKTAQSKESGKPSLRGATDDYATAAEYNKPLAPNFISASIVKWI